MDAQIKQKWVEALRSGEYEQTQKTLKYRDGFCCLGVLCDLQGAEWKRVSHKARVGLSMPSKFAGGLSEKEQSKLMDLNDRGTEFPQIADYIEANL